MKNDNDDAAKLMEISAELRMVDLDTTTAERIAMRARQQVGVPPSPKRWIEPIVTSVVVGGYLVWALIKVVEALS